MKQKLILHRQVLVYGLGEVESEFYVSLFDIIFKM